jgi:hypothetical protein
MSKILTQQEIESMNQTITTIGSLIMSVHS